MHMLQRQIEGYTFINQLMDHVYHSKVALMAKKTTDKVDKFLNQKQNRQDKSGKYEGRVLPKKIV